MNLPPKTTLLFRNIPSSTTTPPVLGLDLQYFQPDPTRPFKGIKLIDPGFHILQFAQSEQSIKHGYCFFTENDRSESEILVVEYVQETEEIKIVKRSSTYTNAQNVPANNNNNNNNNNEEEELQRLVHYDYNFMVPYKSLMNDEKTQIWHSLLTGYITEELLQKIVVPPKTLIGSGGDADTNDAHNNIDGGGITDSYSGDGSKIMEIDETLDNEAAMVTEKTKQGGNGKKEVPLISTVTTSTEENQELLDALKQRIQHTTTDTTSANPNTNPSTLIDDAESKFQFTRIHNFKHPATIRPNATIQQKTQDSLDKTWYTEHVILQQNDNSKGGENRIRNNEQNLSYSILRNLNELIGEFQFTFLLTLLFANYAAAKQYSNILKLLTHSETLLVKTNFFERWKFLDIMYAQLQLLPMEYVSESAMANKNRGKSNDGYDDDDDDDDDGDEEVNIYDDEEEEHNEGDKEKKTSKKKNGNFHDLLASNDIDDQEGENLVSVTMVTEAVRNMSEIINDDHPDTGGDSNSRVARQRAKVAMKKIIDTLVEKFNVSEDALMDENDEDLPVVVEG